MEASKEHSRAGRTAPRKIGSNDAARAERAVRELRAVDYRRGGGACQEAVRVQLAEVRRMMAGSMAEAVRARLALVLADLHNLAGWTSFDLGMVDEAHQHFGCALELANAGEHDDLAANVHYRIGRVYLHHDNPSAALAEFDHGRAAAQRARSALSLAILSANQAWAHAKLHHADETLQLLGRAEDEFAAADFGNAPSWARFFDANDLTAMIGIVHTELAQTVDPTHTTTAVPAVTAAIAGYSDDMARSRAFNITALAVNHLIDGDADAAHAAGVRALEAGQAVLSTRVRDRMRPLLRLAQSQPEQPELRELAERVSAFIDSPG